MQILNFVYLTKIFSENVDIKAGILEENKSSLFPWQCKSMYLPEITCFINSCSDYSKIKKL